MDEDISFWSKKPADLTIADQTKFMIIAPVITAAAIFVPLYLFGAVVEIRERRKLKKQNVITLVEPPTEDE